MQSMDAFRLTLIFPSMPDDDDFFRRVQALLAEADLLPDLARVLSRADVKTHQNITRETLICRLFGLSEQAGTPVAALRALADGLEHAQDKHWLCADPVHLHPDLDHLLLFDSSQFELTAEEASEYIAELNSLFADDDITFYAPAPTRWYASLPQRPDVSLSPLPLVSGQNILHYLPEGGDAKHYRRHLNEIQMQMTACQVNDLRAERGELAINSVWLWGQGQLPDKPARCYRQVYTNDVFVQGLADYSQAPFGALTDTPSALNDDALRGALLVFDELNGRADEYAWREFLLWFESGWLPGILAFVKADACSECVIYINACSYTINRKTLRRWWRRKSGIESLLKCKP